MKTKLLLIVLSIFMFSACNNETKNIELSKPNVIIILADDMGYGDVSSCNPTARTSTPNIDKLAGQGISFTDAHSAGSVCVPSRYGILTGRHLFRVPKDKSRAGWGYGSPLIESGRETIGTLMQKAGYATACIGKWHLGLEWSLKDSTLNQIPDVRPLAYTNTDFGGVVGKGPNTLGFDYSFIMPASLDMAPYVFVKNDRVVDPEIVMVSDVYARTKNGTIDAYDKGYVNDNDIYWGRGVWWRNGEMSASFRVEDCLDVIVNEGTSFIEEHVSTNPEKPFMLYLPLTGPHTPWVPAEKFKNSSDLGTYGDFISEIDDVVLRIKNTLKKLNIDDNTIVVFSSDNGGHWSEEDKLIYSHQSNWSSRGQKGDAWNGGHHIPLIVNWPAKIKKPVKIEQTVGLIDIITTLSDLTETEIEDGYAEDSQSFYHLLDESAPKQPEREHIIYYSSGRKLAVQAGDWKYIDCLGSGGFSKPFNPKSVEGGPTAQLYNMKEDPLEQNNLYLKEPEIVQDLSHLLDSLVNK